MGYVRNALFQSALSVLGDAAPDYSTWDYNTLYDEFYRLQQANQPVPQALFDALQKLKAAADQLPEMTIAPAPYDPVAEAAAKGRGVTAYGYVWMPGEQPPAGLTTDQLYEWTRSTGYAAWAPSVWAAKAASYGLNQNDPADQPALAAIWDPFFKGTAATMPDLKPASAGPSRYLVGGKEYDNAADAQAALDAQNAAAAAGGAPSSSSSSAVQLLPDIAIAPNVEQLPASGPTAALDAGGASSTSASASASDPDIGVSLSGRTIGIVAGLGALLIFFKHGRRV